MGFNTIWYILFLPLVVFAYYSINHKYRWTLLLLASYFFYGFSEPTFLLLMCSITLIAYFTGFILNNKKSKTILTLSVVLVLSHLLFFKYFEWFYQVLSDTITLFTPNKNTINWSFRSLILPIGISFYTFQGVSYIVDVYKERIKRETHLGHFALYISFFPQLVAGPIESPGFLIPQFKNKVTLSWINFSEGSKLILLGFFKKIVIADSLVIFVDNVFKRLDSPETKGFEVYLAIVGFAYYVYIDFSAYCDIALGSARYFGVELSQNFFKPFSSINVREFWRRWHATLSIWVKNYLFIPMGGVVKNNNLKTLFNVLFVFIVIGLWHGASYNFFFFGLMAGIYMIIDASTKNLRYKFFNRINFTNDKLIPRFIFKFVTFSSFLSVAIFARITDFNDLSIIIKKLLHFFSDFNFKIDAFIVVGATFFITEGINYFSKNGKFHPFDSIKNSYFRVSFYVVIIFTILIFSVNESANFYYFRF
ncbi:MBOAT family protein [Vicingus serpentipes]|uniref:MBOAT family protein n=1 Tax=Vicingus serpentipes TaxID=1926625 RepID=A0A5C6RPT1_9FLAO|nr:MBOAT family O-acyltransferase [Vicingus serpentipes]TXB64203.1 MBOAT family protein [Vicingus serpentipes]